MDDLARMDWEALRRLRAQSPQNLQATLAPYEHRAFARESVGDNPWSAPLYLALVPGYQAAKGVGLLGARTGPSMDQLKQGLLGAWEGLRGVKSDPYAGQQFGVAQR